MKERIREKAKEIGFDAVGFANLTIGAAARTRLDTFISQGHHGEMDWMEKNGYKAEMYDINNLRPSDEELEKNFNSFSKVEEFPQHLWEARWGDSNDVAKFCEIKDRDDVSGPVDLAFIDGNHTYDYCYNDAKNLILTNTIWPEKGLIVFHDILMNTVKLAIKQLKKDFGLDVFYMPQRSIALARVVYK